MGRMVRLLMLLLVASATLAYAQDVRPGDQVRFIERDQHTPAHPAPDDSRVHLRFVSGFGATVLRVDAATGWIEVQGEPLQGTANTGWITPRYLASHPDGGEPASDALAWCPPKGLPAPHPSGCLRLATWNLENLHAQDGQSTYTGSDPSVKRTATDYERIRCYVRLFDPDILAVQEVDGEAALSRVVDLEVYDVHVDDRPKGALNGQQNTGFAVKRGLTVVRQPDAKGLDIRGDGSLRYGTRIDLTHQGQTIQLLSIHLKSGCFENASTSTACETLLAHIAVLEGWIDAAAQGPTPLIVLGDFNGRFTQPNDRVWADLDGGEPANADLATLTQEMPVSCRDNTFTEFIDHIVVDGGSCPGSIAPRSATSRTARPTKPSGISSPTTGRCSSSCGSGNEGAAGEEAVDDALALNKEPGSTSDQSCFGTFNVSTLVGRLNTPLMPGGNEADLVPW